MWEPEAKTKPSMRRPIRDDEPSRNHCVPRFEPGKAVRDLVVADLTRDPRADPPHGRRTR